LKPPKIETEFVIKEDELSLSNNAISELLKATLAKKIPFKFRVKGSSMAPFIKDDDVVTISPLSASAIKLGMCVAFLHPENKKLAIHRVIGKAGKTYAIKGDNSYQIDGYFAQESILGYVSAIKRNGSNFYLGLGSEGKIIAFLNLINLLVFIRLAWRFIPWKMRKPLRLF
jgi:signal peptidase I